MLPGGFAGSTTAPVSTAVEIWLLSKITASAFCTEMLPAEPVPEVKAKTFPPLARFKIAVSRVISPAVPDPVVEVEICASCCRVNSGVFNVILPASPSARARANIPLLGSAKVIPRSAKRLTLPAFPVLLLSLTILLLLKVIRPGLVIFTLPARSLPLVSLSI